MRWLALLVGVVGWAWGQTIPATPTEEPPLRVLFLGNSYTYYNALPDLVETLAAATPGRKIDALQVTRGGATLAELWSVTQGVKVLREGSWDVVVLQDQSTLGQNFVDGRWYVNEPEGTLRWARFWHEEIRRKNAKTMLYLTWARKARPEFQAALNYAYSETARALEAEIAPAGLAWQRLRATAPQIELFDPDGSHPAPAGTLLTACVFLEALTGRGCGAIAKPPAIVKLEEAAWKDLTEAAHFAVEQVKAGALNNLLRPDYGPARSLPVADPNSQMTDFEATWRGTALLHNGAYDMELQLQASGKSCLGTLQLLNARAQWRFAYPVSGCTLDQGVLTFLTSDPRGLLEEYQAVRQDGKLVGLQRLRSIDPYVRLQGRFELRRDAGN